MCILYIYKGPPLGRYPGGLYTRSMKSVTSRSGEERQGSNTGGALSISRGEGAGGDLTRIVDG